MNDKKRERHRAEWATKRLERLAMYGVVTQWAPPAQRDEPWTVAAGEEHHELTLDELVPWLDHLTTELPALVSSSRVVLRR